MTSFLNNPGLGYFLEVRKLIVSDFSKGLHFLCSANLGWKFFGLQTSKKNLEKKFMRPSVEMQFAFFSSTTPSSKTKLGRIKFSSKIEVRNLQLIQSKKK
jgi:hypothetical protein